MGGWVRVCVVVCVCVYVCVEGGGGGWRRGGGGGGGGGGKRGGLGGGRVRGSSCWEGEWWWGGAGRGESLLALLRRAGCGWWIDSGPQLKESLALFGTRIALRRSVANLAKPRIRWRVSNHPWDLGFSLVFDMSPKGSTAHEAPRNPIPFEA